MQFIAIEQTCVCVVKSAVTHRCICFRLVVGKTLESFGMVCWWEQIHINMWDISQRMRDFRLRQTQLPSALHSHAISTVNIQHIAIVHFTTTSRLRQKRREKIMEREGERDFWGAEWRRLQFSPAMHSLTIYYFQLLSRSKIVKNRILHFFYYYIEPSRSAFFQ